MPAESREPKAPPTVTGVNQRPRISGPRRLDIVAGCMSESVRFASVQVSKPKIPIAAVELAVSEPVAIWGHGRIPSLADVERSNVSGLISTE